ncbi:MAG: glycosyltransferase family 4 protein [Planctomycetota bacterium]
MTTDCVGGVWTYAMTLCRGLVQQGVEVTLAASGGPLDEAKRRDVPAGVTLRHRPLKCEWMQPPLADVEEAGEWLDELVAEFRPDVIHLNDYAHGSRDFGGRPRLVVAHSDVYSWHAAVLRRAPDASWRGYRDVVEAGLAGADAVVAPTRAVLDGMRAWIGDRSAAGAAASGRVIANAVDGIGEPAGKREPFVLSAGRVWDEAKNVKLLAEAAGGFLMPVKIAGDARHPDGGEASFDGVELLGPLPHAELLALMRRASIYALPAKYEPFGLSAVEAALSGCALVLGDIPSLREVWGDAATFVSPNDADQLRLTLRRLVDDEAARRRLATLARDRAKTFTVERQASAYAGLYRELVGVKRKDAKGQSQSKE